MIQPYQLLDESLEVNANERLKVAKATQTSFSQYAEEQLGEVRLVHLDDLTDLHSIYDKDKYNGIVWTYPLNGVHRIDKDFRHINTLLTNGEVLVVCFESQLIRRSRLINRKPKILGYLDYYGWDFFFHRILPRLKLTKSLYFRLTGGKNRVLSITEGLGRLIAGGFEIIDYKNAGNLTHVVTKKSGEPMSVKGASYGLFIKLKRVGFKGNQINMLKIRTMRPYSEYLQRYLYEKHGTVDGDKIRNDFRVTKWGVYFRKFWIDELPMLLNFVKGDLKLVGVRPLSQHKYDTYPEYLQELRIKVKPGLVPPYYADLPSTPEDFFKCEEKYLLSYLKSPIKTDIRYFFKALTNIMFRGARSK